MIGRDPLGIARPLRPVIGSRHAAGKRQARRGAALVWRTRALRPGVVRARPLAEPKWTLTVNLFVKALLGLRQAQLQQRGMQAIGRSPLKLRARAPAAGREPPPAAAKLLQTLGIRNVLQHVLLPGASSLEVIRRNVPELVFTAIRERARVIRELSWTHSPVRREILVTHKEATGARALESAVTRAYASGPDTIEPPRETSSSGRRTRRAHLPLRISRARTIEIGVPRIARMPAAPVTNMLLTRQAFTRAAGAAVTVPSRSMGVRPWATDTPALRASRTSVELVWPSRTADAAASNSLLPSSQAPTGARGTIGVDLTPVSSPAAPPQPELPNVDRLVDEVMRRFDRHYRVERMRRGI